MPKDQRDEEKERLSIEGIRNNFAYTTALIRRSLSDIRKKTITYAVGAFVFLTLRYMSGPIVPTNILTTILIEGLSIGGWVFLWEAFSLLFLGTRNEQPKQTVSPIARSQIIFKYQ